MAKIVGGGMFGFLSGKIGGLVFAFNQGGQYVRQYVKPVDTNTVAQQRARTRFTASSGGYHSLLPSVKALWGAFATNVFNPKFGTNVGQISGFNSYVSLANGVNNGNNLPATTVFELNGAPVAVPATFGTFAIPATPPVATQTPNIREALTGAPLPLTINTITVTANGSWDAVLDVGGSPVGGSDVDDFIDSNGNKFGFAVYISNGVEQENMFIQNPEKYCLGYVQPPTLGALDRTAVVDYGIATTVPAINVGDYGTFPTVGQTVRASVYAISETGMFAKLGATDIQVTV